MPRRNRLTAIVLQSCLIARKKTATGTFSMWRSCVCSLLRQVALEISKAKFSHVKVRAVSWLENQQDNVVIKKLLNMRHVVNGGFVHYCDAPRRDVPIKWTHFCQVINVQVKKCLPIHVPLC